MPIGKSARMWCGCGQVWAQYSRVADEQAANSTPYGQPTSDQQTNSCMNELTTQTQTMIIGQQVVHDLNHRTLAEDEGHRTQPQFDLD